MKLIKVTSIASAAIICLLLVSCNPKGKNAEDTGVKTDGKQVYSDTSASSVRVFDQNGRVCVQQSNTYYEVVDVYQESTKIPLLLKIKKTELCFADSINKDKVYEVSAKSVMDTKNNVSWKVQFVATDLQFNGNTMLAVHEAGDNEEDFLKRFGLLDGKEVFSSSYGEVKVAIPNVKDKRFIGYTSQKAASAPLKELNEENLLGVIRYGSSMTAGNAAKVKLKRSKVTAKIPLTTPDIILVPSSTNTTTAIEDGKSLILMKADEHYQPADVKDFSVKLTFYYGDDNEATYIIIPVVDDKLDLVHAQYDKDIFELTAF